MDAERFDTLTRIVADSSSRRTMLTRIAGAVVALVIPGHDDANAKRKPSRRDRPSAQGPCGNGGAKVNRCSRHNQCCTGFCDRQIKRCRCRHRGQSCDSDRNCCRRGGQQLSCHNGRCRPAAACHPTSCPVCRRCETDRGRCVPDTTQERACCPTASGSGGWCRSGQCVALPINGSNDDCQGVCNGNVTICGQAVNCPACGDCPCGAGACDVNGAFGRRVYCVQSPIGDPCGSCPAGTQCCDGTGCVAVCV